MHAPSSPAPHRTAGRGVLAATVLTCAAAAALLAGCSSSGSPSPTTTNTPTNTAAAPATGSAAPASGTGSAQRTSFQRNLTAPAPFKVTPKDVANSDSDYNKSRFTVTFVAAGSLSNLATDGSGDLVPAGQEVVGLRISAGNGAGIAPAVAAGPKPGPHNYQFTLTLPDGSHPKQATNQLGNTLQTHGDSETAWWLVPDTTTTFTLSWSTWIPDPDGLTQVKHTSTFTDPGPSANQ